MSELYVAAENGWYIKSKGHMTQEHSYQKVSHLKACRSIEHGGPITFVRINSGREIEDRAYVPNDAIASLKAENAKLQNLALRMYDTMQGVLERSDDTVWAEEVGTLRDCMDVYMTHMKELGFPPRDYEQRCRELGIEVDG